MKELVLMLSSPRLHDDPVVVDTADTVDGIAVVVAVVVDTGDDQPKNLCHVVVVVVEADSDSVVADEADDVVVDSEWKTQNCVLTIDGRDYCLCVIHIQL